MNLADDVTVASIAKVREDKTLMEESDASELVSEEEEAASVAEVAKKTAEDLQETDDELMKDLLERAEADKESEE